MRHYRSKYKLDCIKLMLQGKTNKEIFRQLGCSPKYPQMARKWWNDLSEAEKKQWVELIEAKTGSDSPELKKEQKRSLNTPVSRAKGKAFISRY